MAGRLQHAPVAPVAPVPPVPPAGAVPPVPPAGAGPGAGGAGGPRLLQDDPLARAAAWMWLTVPRRLTARLPFLRDVAGDGHFLSAFPAVAVALPIACLAGGFWYGAEGGDYQFAVTESVFLLSALVALGAFATQLGLVALVGFAVGDFFVRFRVWSYTVVDIGEIDLAPGATSDPLDRSSGLLDSGYVSGLWRVRLPLVLLYLLLAAGALLVPRLARSLAGIALRSARVPRNLDWLVASFAYLVTVWLALLGWTASLPLLVRPYFTWKGGLAGSVPPAQAIVPVQHFRKEIVVAAVVAAMLRQLVVLAIARRRDLAGRVDVVVSLAAPAREARPPTAWGTVLRVLGAGLLGAFLMAGTLERAWTWTLAIAVFVLIALLRSDLLPEPARDVWRRLAGRLPFLVRVALIVVAVRVVAGFMAGSVIGSYESLAVFILLAALASVLLLPPPATASAGAAAGAAGAAGEDAT
jgi:hypothetical protein